MKNMEQSKQEGMVLSQEDVRQLWGVFHDNQFSERTMMPMDVTDLENWENVFSMTIGGIEEHLTNSELNKSYVIGALLGLDRQLEVIIEDMRKEAYQVARERIAVDNVFM